MKKFYIINILSVVLVFVAFISFMSFSPRTYGVANGENREITKFPRFSAEAYFDGKYTEQIATWYTDSIPHRYDFREMVSAIKSYYGIETDLQGSNVHEGAQDSRPESEEEFSFEDYPG